MNKNAQVRTKKIRNFRALTCSKKAQVRMMETITVLFIFFILIAFGFIFYAQFQQGSVERARAEISGQRAVSLSLRAQFLPEIRCTSGDNVIVSDCIDILRMEAFKNVAEENPSYYQQVLGTSHIYVQEIYPMNRTWELYNQTAPASRKLLTPTPVAIKDSRLSDDQSFSFGVLYVEVFT